MKIGVFGGTFDPPHLGHLILAAEAHHQLSLDRVLFVLTPDPPHKIGVPVSPWRYRMDLLMAALQDNAAFELSRVDIDRPAPHYAVDTIHRLIDNYPGAEMILLIGGDSLNELPDWKNPQELVAHCASLGVMPRPGATVDLDTLEKSIPGIRSKVHWIKAPLIEISSSEIRFRVASGRPYRYFIPPAVYSLIRDHNIYQA